ncbi:MAG: hypothetical protein HWN81_19880 [Candidatus Lokiarchaeota archaeon]|nr:hypothetical protein [Candidatus Lokiarchaeota archaeon]
MDIYSQKKHNDILKIKSVIPKEERILFVSEKITNKRLVLTIRILIFVGVILFYNMLFDFFSFSWYVGSIGTTIFNLLFFGIFCFMGYIFGAKTFNYRKDYYLILTEKKFYLYLFSARRNSPVLVPRNLNEIRYVTIKRRLFRQSAILVLYELKNVEIEKAKFRRIKDFRTLKKYFDSVYFHFADVKEDWISKVKYKIPVTLNISKEKYELVNERVKNVNKYFIISTPIAILIGIFLWLIFSDIVVKILALLTYLLFGSCVFGVLGVIYLMLLVQLKRCSSLTDYMIVKPDEIEYNDIKVEFSKDRIFTANYLSSRNTTQYSKKPQSSIYTIEINEIQTFNNKKYFGPIEDFHNYFKFIYFHLLKWKSNNGHLFSKEELYENEIKR